MSSQAILSSCRLSSGHLFCAGCIEKVHSDKCPTCREPFDPFLLQANVFVHRQIAGMKVHCMNREHGCHWTGNLGMNEQTLTDHMFVCEERRISCPRCSQVILAAEAQQHGDEDCKVDADPKRARANRKRKRAELAAAARPQEEQKEEDRAEVHAHPEAAMDLSDEE